LLARDAESAHLVEMLMEGAGGTLESISSADGAGSCVTLALAPARFGTNETTGSSLE
jgi:hypothetical protein